MAAGAMASSARARCESRKYKACLIADSKQGGVGHSMHLAFGLRDDVAVVALAEPDEGARAKYGADAGVERTYADYREMLDKEHPDLVAIGPRWSIHHKEYILACAEVGAHGLIEKPLSVDLEEADAMMTAIGAKNLRWAIGFNVRSMPPIAHLKKLLWEESLIGTILDARGRGKEDARAGGEDLIVLGSHVLDLMAYLMDGAPGWCFSDITVGGRPAKPEDVHDPTEGLGPVVGDRICATYGFAAGVKGFFASMANPDGSGGRFGLDLYGSRGVVTIRIGDTPTIQWIPDSTWAPGGRDVAWQPLPHAPEFVQRDQAHERNRWLVDDLITSIEEGREPTVSLADGRRSQEMIQAVFESYVQQRRVMLPLEARSHPLKRWQ